MFAVEFFEVVKCTCVNMNVCVWDPFMISPFGTNYEMQCNERKNQSSQ